jgi:hypothetical protein
MVVHMSNAPKYIIKALRDARKAATYESACLDNDPVKDAYIKEETRLYNNTWIVHPLDKALKWAEGGKKCPE